MARTRRVASIAILAAGMYVLVLPFALSLFSRTSDADKLDNYYRPLMSAQGIDHFRSNLHTVDSGGQELFGVVLPQLKQTLAMNDSQFDTFVAQNDPHVSAFLQRAPDLLKYLNPATEAVLAQKDHFHDADRFPVSGVPITAGPWALLGLGLVLVGLGLLVRSRLGLVATLITFAIGAGLLVGPLALGWFHETNSAEKVAQAARFPFSPVAANTVVDDIGKIDAAFIEMRQSLFPAVARQLGKSPAEMDSFLHTSFPATMALLDAWDAQMRQGARELSLSQIRYMDEFHNADATPYRALPWLIMAPGLVLLVGSALAFRRRRAVETE